MNRTLSITLFLVLFVCTFSSAHAKGTNLAFRYSPGEVSKYKMTTDMTMGLPSAVGAFKMGLSADMTEKVLAVYKDGSAKLLITLKNIKMTGAGMQNSKSNKVPDKKATVVVSRYGKLISSNADSSLIDATTGSVNPMSSTSAQSMTFPGKAINVGESWKNVLVVPNVGSKVYMTNTLLSNTTSFNGHKTSKIKQSLTTRIDLAKALAAGTEGNRNSGLVEDINGTMDIQGSTIYHFSALKGKMLASNGKYKIITNMIMPTSAKKQGTAPSVKMVSNVTVSITKQ